MRADQLHQKLGLVQQLKTLSRQHEQILQAYERKVQEKLRESSLAATSGGKRPGAPQVAEGPEAKRHRQLAERANRKQDIWNEVTKIVEKIRKHGKSEPFRQAVDPIKLKIPDYWNVIKKPMDISTIQKKLKAKQYASPAEVAEDMRQIWINCRTYNGLNHVVSIQANICSEAFEKAWGQANIEQRWSVELTREQREEQAFAGGEGEAGDDTLVSQLRYKRNMLGDLIAAKDVQDNLPPGSLGDLAPDRDMTFEEKRKLSAHMASLPGEKLVAVLDIISESENIQPDDEGEVEVDIDALHNNTLWKLKAYVDGVLTATSGPPPKKSATRTAPNKQGPPPAAAAAAGGMPPPPPAAVQQGILPQQPLPMQQQPPPPAAGAMPPPPQQPPQFQPPQPMQPPPAQQQQQQGSPVHSAGGVSAQEVVGSTAGGPGAARSHQFTYDMGTVAQSGTNARPSNFVKNNPNRQQTPTGADAAAAGAAAAAGSDAQGKAGAALDADQAKNWEAELLGSNAGGQAAAAAAPGDAAAAAAPGSAAAVPPPPGDAAAAPPAAEAAAAAARPAAAGAAAPDATVALDAAAAPAVKADPAAAAEAPAVKAEAPAAPATAAPAAAAAAAASPPPPAAADAAAPDAAAAAGDGSAAAAEGDADDDGIWGSFQSQAKQQEEELAKQKEAEQQRIAEAEEQKRLKEQQEQQKRREEQEARRAEIFAGMGSASAAGNDDAVHADVEKLLAQVPGVPRGAAPPAAGDAAADGDAMDVDAQQQQDGDDSDDGPGDGGGFD